MAQMSTRQKLEILADAAKYDASCASSGTAKRDSRGGKGIGSTEGMGICHAYAPDGRCISLLKILLTNSCIFDCHYCINRRSSDVRRARFTAREVVDLTLNFYRRNYIEGLFLSSGIIRSSDYTMEQMVEVARSLREAMTIVETWQGDVSQLIQRLSRKASSPLEVFKEALKDYKELKTQIGALDAQRKACVDRINELGGLPVSAEDAAAAPSAV